MDHDSLSEQLNYARLRQQQIIDRTTGFYSYEPRGAQQPQNSSAQVQNYPTTTLAAGGSGSQSSHYQHHPTITTTASTDHFLQLPVLFQVQSSPRQPLLSGGLSNPAGIHQPLRASTPNPFAFTTHHSRPANYGRPPLSQSRAHLRTVLKGGSHRRPHRSRHGILDLPHSRQNHSRQMGTQNPVMHTAPIRGRQSGAQFAPRLGYGPIPSYIREGFPSSTSPFNSVGTNQNGGSMFTLSRDPSRNTSPFSLGSNPSGPPPIDSDRDFPALGADTIPRHFADERSRSAIDGPTTLAPELLQSHVQPGDVRSPSQPREYPAFHTSQGPSFEARMAFSFQSRPSTAEATSSTADVPYVLSSSEQSRSSTPLTGRLHTANESETVHISTPTVHSPAVVRPFARGNLHDWQMAENEMSQMDGTQYQAVGNWGFPTSGLTTDNSQHLSTGAWPEQGLSSVTFGVPAMGFSNMGYFPMNTPQHHVPNEYSTQQQPYSAGQQTIHVPLLSEYLDHAAADSVMPRYDDSFSGIYGNNAGSDLNSWAHGIEHQFEELGLTENNGRTQWDDFTVASPQAPLSHRPPPHGKLDPLAPSFNSDPNKVAAMRPYAMAQGDSTGSNDTSDVESEPSDGEQNAAPPAPSPSRAGDGDDDDEGRKFDSVKDLDQFQVHIRKVMEDANQRHQDKLERNKQVISHPPFTGTKDDDEDKGERASNENDTTEKHPDTNVIQHQEYHSHLHHKWKAEPGDICHPWCAACDGYGCDDDGCNPPLIPTAVHPSPEQAGFGPRSDTNERGGGAQGIGRHGDHDFEHPRPAPSPPTRPPTTAGPSGEQPQGSQQTPGSGGQAGGRPVGGPGAGPPSAGPSRSGPRSQEEEGDWFRIGNDPVQPGEP